MTEDTCCAACGNQHSRLTKGLCGRCYQRALPDIDCPSCHRTARPGARGLCGACYARERKYGSAAPRPFPPVPAGRKTKTTAMEKALRALHGMPLDDCWPWPGRVAPDGYGTAGAKEAHREMYQHFRGSIPAGMELDHRCHNEDPGCTAGTACLHRRCVNPWHLDVVEKRSNASNTFISRRDTCGKGHPYSETNLLISESRGRPVRNCRQCAHEAYLRRRERHQPKR